jgi:hypothetical protein
MQSPGPRGKVHFGDHYHAEHSRTNMLLRLMMAVLILAVMIGVIVWLVPLLPLPTFQAVVLLTGLALIYVSVGYFVHPEPDDSNIGLFGGLIDHPLRYSDDINRWLRGFDMLLAPGRMVAEGFLDALMYRRAARAARATHDDEGEHRDAEQEALLATQDAE